MLNRMPGVQTSKRPSPLPPLNTPSRSTLLPLPLLLFPLLPPPRPHSFSRTRPPFPHTRCFPLSRSASLTALEHGDGLTWSHQYSLRLANILYQVSSSSPQPSAETTSILHCVLVLPSPPTPPSKGFLPEFLRPSDHRSTSTPPGTRAAQTARPHRRSQSSSRKADRGVLCLAFLLALRSSVHHSDHPVSQRPRLKRGVSAASLDPASLPSIIFVHLSDKAALPSIQQALSIAPQPPPSDSPPRGRTTVKTSSSPPAALGQPLFPFFGSSGVE